LRLLARHNGLSLDDPGLREAARLTGADVPVCLDPRARMMRGIGEELGPALDLPPLFAVLANPGVAVPTPAVFRELRLEPGAALAGSPHPRLAAGMDQSTLLAALQTGRNDLEGPALRLQPVIGEALTRLCATAGCRLARMSGSGATVFGVYESRRAADMAAAAIAQARPGWWVQATALH
jgi:4-diphosphocytidyl-2-C-methyl-D-erythritol kinase